MLHFSRDVPLLVKTKFVLYIIHHEYYTLLVALFIPLIICTFYFYLLKFCSIFFQDGFYCMQIKLEQGKPLALSPCD